MKKQLLPVLFFLITITTAFVQVNNKLAPAFRYLISHPLNIENAANYPGLYKVQTVEGFNSASGLYEKGYICIIYTKNAAILADRGITVQSVLPNFVTAWATLNQITRLSEMSEVSYIDAPKIIMPNNDISVGSSGASLLNAGRLNNTVYKGDGVIVGVYDTGIDWDHPDFRNPADQTKSRILRIWDQTITPISGEFSPTGFNYGVEYTQTQLNDELDGTSTGYVREKDLNGHGTHVTGTAAGNGVALTSLKYAGIAPNADIVMVKGGNSSFSTTDIINALTYFQNVATALGKPIVVNMSIGGQSGAHDGSNAEEVAVDNFSNAAAGRVVAIAAGNDNGTAIHRQVSIAPNGSNSMTINVPSSGGSSSTDVFEISIYANNTSAVNATVIVPGGSTVTANAGQSISPNVLSNAATVYLDNVVDAASGLRSITLYVARTNTSSNPSGTWTITLNNTTSNALTIDGWLDYKGNDFSGTTVSGGDNNYLVSSPGTASNAITVASYMAKLDWYSVSTTAPGGYQYTSAQQDNISSFSSKGPRRDNVQKPNIAANGQAVVSCLASDAGISPTSNTVVVQGLYRAIQGTSMATPEVTGCVALLLQVKPTASFSQIRNAITSTATKDVFTTASDNATWGSGKIDVFRAASSLLFCKPSSRTTYSYDSSSTNINNSTQNLSSNKVATRFTPDLTGKLGGVYFKTGTTITLSSFTIEVRTNSSGIPGTLLGSMSIVPSSISKFSWNYYDVSALNIDVTNGTDYFIVLVPGGSDSWTLGFESLSNSGRSFVNNGSSWVANNDLRIRSVVYDNSLPITSSVTNLSICPSQLPYTWNGVSFNAAGSQTAHLTNSVGCDSAATLNLTIKSNSTSTSNTSICASQLPYVWNGLSFNSAGSQTAHLTNSAGCDSAATLNLTVKSNSTSTTNATICSGSTYSFNGTNYSNSGLYTAHLTNSVGCDSAATLILNVGILYVSAVNIATDVNNVCANTGITITATPTNGGTAPNYNFKVNGISKQNGPADTYTSFTFANNDVVTCVITRSDACATPATSNSIVMTIKATPAAPLITNGAIQNCVLGSSTSLYVNNWNGVWNSSNTNIASTSTGNTGSNSVIITAVANGTAVITYTITNPVSGCSSSVSANYSVVSVPVNAINAAASICANGATIQATNTTPNGVWASENNRVSISNTGLVTSGASAGTGLISYTVTNATTGCSTKLTKAITVNAVPAIPGVAVSPAISNPNALCSGGRVYNFTGIPGGGVFASSNNAVASFAGNVMTTGNTINTPASISYTITGSNGCTSNRSFTGQLIACFAREASNSINPSTIQSFNLYPNPAKGVVSIKVNRLIGEGTIIIADVYGKVVYSSIVNSPSTIVDISHLNKALYFVSIITNAGKTTKKLMVE